MSAALLKASSLHLEQHEHFDDLLLLRGIVADGLVMSLGIETHASSTSHAVLNRSSMLLEILKEAKSESRFLY